MDLLEIVRPCIRCVLALRAANTGVSYDVRDLQRRLAGEITTVERLATEDGYSQDQVRLVRYALVSLVDEIAQASEQGLRVSWMQHPLQMELLGVTDAGEGFFRRLDELLTIEVMDDRSTDVLEIYAMCLGLGFVGKYGARLDVNRAELSELRKRVLDRLESRRDALEQGVARERPPRRPEPPRTWLPWSIAVLSIGLALSGLAGLRCGLGDQEQRLIDQLEGTPL